MENLRVENATPATRLARTLSGLSTTDGTPKAADSAAKPRPLFNRTNQNSPPQFGALRKDSWGSVSSDGASSTGNELAQHPHTFSLEVEDTDCNSKSSLDGDHSSLGSRPYSCDSIQEEMIGLPMMPVHAHLMMEDNCPSRSASAPPISTEKLPHVCVEDGAPQNFSDRKADGSDQRLANFRSRSNAIDIASGSRQRRRSLRSNNSGSRGVPMRGRSLSLSFGSPNPHMSSSSASFLASMRTEAASSAAKRLQRSPRSLTFTPLEVQSSATANSTSKRRRTDSGNIDSEAAELATKVLFTTTPGGDGSSPKSKARIGSSGSKAPGSGCSEILAAGYDLEDMSYEDVFLADEAEDAETRREELANYATTHPDLDAKDTLQIPVPCGVVAKGACASQGQVAGPATSIYGAGGSHGGALRLPFGRRGTVSHVDMQKSRRPGHLLPDGPDVRGDRLKKCILPTTMSYHPFHPSIRLITTDTVHDILDHKFDHILRDYIIIDTRFPFEYDGGHIKSALNFWTMERCVAAMLTQPIADMSHGARIPIIFHCEFSSMRAPTMYKYLRDLDQEITFGRDTLIYPELYVMLGGYEKFYAEHPEDCTPQQYIKMKDKRFDAENEQYENILSRSRAQASQKKWQHHSTVQTLTNLVQKHGVKDLGKSWPPPPASPGAHADMPVSPRTPCSQILA